MTRENYTKEQNILIAEFAATYGLEPEQITFFTGDPKPFFDREATAVLLHRLTNAVGIEDDLVASPFADSLSVKYRVTFEDGSFAASTASANFNETIDGEPMSPEQIKSLATSRASRGALVNKGIDLVKLHYANVRGNVSQVQFSGPPLNNSQKLRREAHALGYETGYIFDVKDNECTGKTYADKTGWRRILDTRYGVTGTVELQEAELADLVAFLRTQLPRRNAGSQPASAAAAA